MLCYVIELKLTDVVGLCDEDSFSAFSPRRLLHIDLLNRQAVVLTGDRSIARPDQGCSWWHFSHCSVLSLTLLDCGSFRPNDVLRFRQIFWTTAQVSRPHCELSTVRRNQGIFYAQAVQIVFFASSASKPKPNFGRSLDSPGKLEKGKLPTKPYRPNGLPQRTTIVYR